MDSSIQIEKAASAWLAKRDGGNWTDADQAMLEAWLQASTAHRVAFIRLEFVWQQALRLRVLGASEQPGVPENPAKSRFPAFEWRRSQQAEALAAPAVNQAQNVRGSTPRVRHWALAASVVLVAGLLAWAAHFMMMSGASYSTAIGGLASVPMVDGSKVTLNTNSEIRVAVSDSERRVNLEQGEAFFQVAKDPSRPFVVIAGSERVVAVGTQFSVRRDEHGLRVVVTEGRVRVEPPRGSPARPVAELTAGSIAQSGGEGVLIQQRPIQEAEDFLSWRRGYLVFRNTTLTDAVAEFNRYTTSRIAIEDAEVGALRIGGNFRSDNVEAFLRLLQEGFDIDVEKRDEALVLKRH